jgi:UDP-2,3-diacylglucosamine pyrophosphatase LpxH
MSSLFISDLHLEDSRPEVLKWLLDFLSGPARRADALYILGDLFEYWIGDDAAPPALHWNWPVARRNWPRQAYPVISSTATGISCWALRMPPRPA